MSIRTEKVASGLLRVVILRSSKAMLSTHTTRVPGERLLRGQIASGFDQEVTLSLLFFPPLISMY